MTTSLLVTLIFLLSDGSPAKDARVVCPSIPTYAAGDDTGAPTNNAALILDSRGAVVIEVAPSDLYCYATFHAQRGEWTVPVEDAAVIRLMLEAE